MGLNRKAADSGVPNGLRPQKAARDGKARRWELRLAEAETLLESRPDEAAPELGQLAKAPAPPAVRAQALALLAFREAALGSAAGLAAAEQRLSHAVALKVSSPVARGRVAHARGYLAYKRGEHALVVSELNKAASLYPADDPRRAHVFDTLGMQFENGIGDLERARSYYLLSIDLKRKAAEQHGLESQRNGLALTYGNLGRLELARERHAEAERHFREDLALILAAEPRPTSEAHVRNQLARALYAQGPERMAEAREELDRALAVVIADSVAHAYILKDLARVALRRGDTAGARVHVQEAREIVQRMGYREVLFWIAVVQGELSATQAKRAGDDSFMHAMSAFDEALAGFERMHMPREICDVALRKADLLERLGKKYEALRILRDVALPLAERHLFAQVQPLSRIETRIGALSPETIHEIRGRRMLGGVSQERYNARLRGERHRLTVWTCDIRGFTRYCTETRDPLLVVDMLNRFFAALGAPILDHGGRIDKYVGDNILAYFRDPATAAHMALWALWAMDQLNTEREHLAEQRLEIGIGLSTGEVVEGNVGFAGKLEHTIIGTPVNTACRLVSEADPGQILIDGPTRNALGDDFLCVRAGRETISLKGLGEIQVFELKGTMDAAPMSRRGDSRWAVR